MNLTCSISAKLPTVTYSDVQLNICMVSLLKIVIFISYQTLFQYHTSKQKHKTFCTYLHIEGTLYAPKSVPSWFLTVFKLTTDKGLNFQKKVVNSFDTLCFRW